MHRSSVLAILLLTLAVVTGCSRKAPSPHVFTHDVVNRYTPVKNQGQSQSCWIYAMLAAIETEHIMRGDSVNLSAAYVEQQLRREPSAPSSGRGMGATLLMLLDRYGVTAYDAMPDASKPQPRWVFMYGAQYTPQEFAHSVCAPGEYVALTSDPHQPYGQLIDLDFADNWTHERFLNVHIDTLLRRTVRAVEHGHGVCWESRRHAMAIVGLAHDERQLPYFVMKNSWGTDRPYGGLDYLSFEYFRRHTLAVSMTREAFLLKNNKGLHKTETARGKARKL